MTGYIHSIETFGTVDGPGVRLVVFCAGCPLRCQYCHNPDTWTTKGATTMNSDEILEIYERNKGFYTDGGITVSGGEPLMQMDFLIDLLSKAKEKGIHTCVDTSGITFSPTTKSKFDELIKYVDLFLLDIKHIDDDIHKVLTGKSNKPVIEFAKYLDANNKDMDIRHVIVDGFTKDEDELFRLGKFIGTLKHVKYLEVLPYHDMAKSKYKKLGINYILENVAPTTKEEAIHAKKIILKGIVESKKEI